MLHRNKHKNTNSTAVSIKLNHTSHVNKECSKCLPAASTLEFERSTKKWIGPSTRFYVHNFSRPRTRSDLPRHSLGHLQTSFTSRIFC